MSISIPFTRSRKNYELQTRVFDSTLESFWNVSNLFKEKKSKVLFSKSEKKIKDLKKDLSELWNYSQYPSENLSKKILFNKAVEELSIMQSEVEKVEKGGNGENCGNVENGKKVEKKNHDQVVFIEMETIEKKLKTGKFGTENNFDNRENVENVEKVEKNEKNENVDQTNPFFTLGDCDNSPNKNTINEVVDVKKEIIIDVKPIKNSKVENNTIIENDISDSTKNVNNINVKNEINVKKEKEQEKERNVEKEEQQERNGEIELSMESENEKENDGGIEKEVNALEENHLEIMKKNRRKRRICKCIAIPCCILIFLLIISILIYLWLK
jgi:hypothetical protein